MPNPEGPLGSRELAALKRSGVDGALVLDLETYSEREGSAAGGEPATVAFTMRVVGTSDGAEVWRGTYFFRQQQDLTDNWLKLGERVGPGGRGAGLTSALEELERGIRASVTDFGARRERQFLARAK